MIQDFLGAKKKPLPFQEQAKKWVKNMEASKALEIVDLQVSYICSLLLMYLKQPYSFPKGQHYSP